MHCVENKESMVSIMVAWLYTLHKTLQQYIDKGRLGTKESKQIQEVQNSKQQASDSFFSLLAQTLWSSLCFYVAALRYVPMTNPCERISIYLFYAYNEGVYYFMNWSIQYYS